MIIKRKQQEEMRRSAATPVIDPLFEDMGLSEDMEEWSAEAVEDGRLPERRSRVEPPPDERRRGYRRVEDKTLISKALEEATAIRENAYREGFESGIDASKAVTDQLNETIAHLMSVREDGLTSSADEIASLAMAVAEKIIKTEVACDRSMVIQMVRDTIERAGKQNRTIIVKVHPDDVSLVKQALKEEPIPHTKAELLIVDDPLVDPGSCIVETNSGLVDASFTTQLEILRKLFGEGR